MPLSVHHLHASHESEQAHSPNPIEIAHHLLTPDADLEVVRYALWDRAMPLKTEGTASYLESDPSYDNVFEKLAPVPKLLIRSEYKEFLEHLVKLSESDHPHPSRVFLTGQPGIGERFARCYQHSLTVLGHLGVQGRASASTTSFFTVWSHVSQ